MLKTGGGEHNPVLQTTRNASRCKWKGRKEYRKEKHHTCTQMSTRWFPS